MSKRTVSFKTFGCKVNQYETQAIRERFLDGHYRETRGRADIYVINSCTVTADADRDCRSLIRVCHRENPEAKIVVTGCYAQKDGNDILKVGGVTHLVRQHDKARLRDILEGTEAVRPEAPSEYVPLRISDFQDHTRAFVKVQDGCDYRCTFCKVWVVRGKSFSRPLREIVQEVDRLTERGFKEIVLTGVSIGLYGRDLSEASDLMDLVLALERLARLKRIRLSSIDPIDVTGSFIEKLFRSRLCCRQLHLSLQSGSDHILMRMNRNYTSTHYREIVRRLRGAIPDFSITTDVIVGFPGEEEAHFQETMDLIEEILPTRVHIFPYSARKGTVANRLQESLSPPILRERVGRLKALTLDCSLRYRQSLLGQTVPVLLEGPEGDGMLDGYTDRYVRVRCQADSRWIGKIVPVKIERLEGQKTFARLV